MRKFMTLCVAITVGACSNGGGADTQKSEVDSLDPSATQISFAQSASPSDKAIAALYDRSCRTCHSQENSGAPLTGHAAAWRARFDKKDMAKMIESTKDGFNAMPPMGLCNDCSDEQFKELITFMAQGK